MLSGWAVVSGAGSAASVAGSGGDEVSRIASGEEKAQPVIASAVINAKPQNLFKVKPNNRRIQA